MKLNCLKTGYIPHDEPDNQMFALGSCCSKMADYLKKKSKIKACNKKLNESSWLNLNVGYE